MTLRPTARRAKVAVEAALRRQVALGCHLLLRERLGQAKLGCLCLGDENEIHCAKTMAYERVPQR